MTKRNAVNFSLKAYFKRSAGHFNLETYFKKWRRSRMKYYFIFSVVLLSALVLANLFFLRRFF
ncbi:MAG TPA: hypothetical protein VFA47_06730 [Candidatus Manganitrophaceae bacterium]|nr:hypothetical protein [Candidatus Manganitrophaceae bacterium]